MKHISVIWVLFIFGAALLDPQAHPAASSHPHWGIALAGFRMQSVLPASLRECPEAFFVLQGSRCAELHEANEGYQKSGVSLIAIRGGRWFPAGYADDLGLYYFAPLLAAMLHSRPERGSDCLFTIILLVCFLLSATGTARLFSGCSIRRIAQAVVALIFLMSAIRGDVYLVLAAILMAMAPWALYFCRMKTIPWAAWPAAFLAGIAAVVVNAIRLNSGTAALIFVMLLVIFSAKWPLVRRAVLVATIAAGATLSIIYEHHVLSHRDAVLETLEPDYHPAVARHPIWHVVYVGLGFLPNRYGLEYRDEVAAAKVKSIDPTAVYMSPPYQTILRGQVMRMVREHLGFVLETLAAKIAVILVFLAVFGNVGLLAAIRCPKPWPIEAAFWGTLFFSAIPGILAVPHPQFLEGFIALAAYYNMVSIDWWRRETQHSRSVSELPAGHEAFSSM